MIQNPNSLAPSLSGGGWEMLYNYYNGETSTSTSNQLNLSFTFSSSIDASQYSEVIFNLTSTATNMLNPTSIYIAPDGIAWGTIGVVSSSSLIYTKFPNHNLATTTYTNPISYIKLSIKRVSYNNTNYYYSDLEIGPAQNDLYLKNGILYIFEDPIITSAQYVLTKKPNTDYSNITPCYRMIVLAKP